MIVKPEGTRGVAIFAALIVVNSSKFSVNIMRYSSFGEGVRFTIQRLFHEDYEFVVVGKTVRWIEYGKKKLQLSEKQLLF